MMLLRAVGFTHPTNRPRSCWVFWAEASFCGGPIGVVKLLRARGGCLGVIRIRAWKAAISPGELPNERRARNTRETQGTETSQYLEEKKSTETPSVAASERGSAQTGRDTVRGCGAGVVE